MCACGEGFLRYMYVVKRGSIWPTSYLYLTGYDMEWANFRKEIVEEMEKQYRGRGLNFFFPMGEKVPVLRLNYIRPGYNKARIISFTWRNQLGLLSAMLYSSRCIVHRAFYMKNISWSSALFTWITM